MGPWESQRPFYGVFISVSKSSIHVKQITANFFGLTQHTFMVSQFPWVRSPGKCEESLSRVSQGHHQCVGRSAYWIFQGKAMCSLIHVVCRLQFHAVIGLQYHFRAVCWSRAVYHFYLVLASSSCCLSSLAMTSSISKVSNSGWRSHVSNSLRSALVSCPQLLWWDWPHPGNLLFMPST